MISGNPFIHTIYRIAYRENRPGTVQNAAAVIHKFLVVLEVGDKVITYDPGLPL